mmetsp:Transcript_916/g.2112  ORF Transcript_916/g.2112 Transcript_916/m.2112 type:complete len:218 (+) Transcript_916:132-785(+)
MGRGACCLAVYLSSSLKGLFMKRYAEVVYSLRATMWQGSSSAATAVGCRIKSSRRSPFLPLSLIPLGYSFSDAGSLRIYNKSSSTSLAAGSSDVPASLITSSLIPSTSRLRLTKKGRLSTHSLARSPCAASPGIPVFNSPRLPANFESASDTGAADATALASCFSSSGLRTPPEGAPAERTNPFFSPPTEIGVPPSSSRDTSDTRPSLAGIPGSSAQ